MNREDLIDKIFKSAKVTKKDASEILTATIETIENTVKKGEKVTFVGFGTFKYRQRAARTGRNPQAKKLKLPLKKFLHFQQAKSLKY